MEHTKVKSLISNHTTGRLTRKRYIGLLYILPWLIGFLVLQLYPLIMSFYYSFTDYNMFAEPNFIGLKNYIDVFTKDLDFWPSMKATLLYVFMGVPAKLIFALLIAMILNQKLRAINLFRTVYYIPSILGGSVAVSLVWRMMFMKEGSVNALLDVLQIPKVNWLGTPFIALITISLLIVWQFGSSMVIFLSGLKQIPNELYEAARVDGASRINMFFNITIPQLTPLIFFNLIMQMISAVQDFTSAFVITNGGPLKGTYLYGMKLYNDAFSYFKMGYASALSWIMFAVIFIITIILFGSSNKWVYYEDGGKSL